MGMLGSVETTAPRYGEPLPVELMNTIWADRAGIHDAFDDPADATAWLRAIAPRTALVVPATTLRGSLISQLRVLRDGLRRLAAETTADPREHAASDTRDLTAAVNAVNTAAAATPSWPALTWTHTHTPARHLTSAGNPTSALVALIAQDAIEFFASQRRDQLRACLAPGCVLYFVKNHPRREWCSASCGNRARVARHYQRNHNSRSTLTQPRRS
jgi:predicted RNA-binding Zn ribbon-like protein